MAFRKMNGNGVGENHGDGNELDENTLDENSLDKDGLDKDGLDKDGLDKDGLDKYGLDKRGLMPGMVATLGEWLHRERMRSVPHRCSDGKWRLSGDDPAGPGDGRVHTSAVLCGDGKWRPVAAHSSFRGGVWDGTNLSISGEEQAHALLSSPLPDGLLDGVDRPRESRVVENIDELLEAHAEASLFSRLQAEPSDPNRSWDWHALCGGGKRRKKKGKNKIGNSGKKA